MITGATASGKSALAVAVAARLGCEIISADSRQIYREIPVGTAAPTAFDMAAVPHHFVGTKSVRDEYNAAAFSDDVLRLLPRLWERSDYAVMCGGSMMYVDAVTDGIDVMPDVPAGVRQSVASFIAENGIGAAVERLRSIDPEAAATVDISNPRRVARALEINIITGRPVAEIRRRAIEPRPFRIIKTAIDMPRSDLFARINTRVGAMVDAGFVGEARSVYPLRGLNALNTVGYKELFAYFDGFLTLDEALTAIARNTRAYAKKQLTWLARPSVRPTVWLSQDNPAAALEALL